MCEVKGEKLAVYVSILPSCDPVLLSAKAIVAGYHLLKSTNEDKHSSIE